jgi:predicted DsbA family dithiol-disulfide isomerase
VEWLERQFGAHVLWLPFQLHPEYPPEGIPRAELVARYGEGSQDRLRAWFKAEGLTYAPNPDVVPNTRSALELGEAARAEGLHRVFNDRLMDAYWVDGLDLTRREVLEPLAREVGVTNDGIAGALDDHAYAAAVDALTQQAVQIGATGVPAFLMERRVLVMGAQPREVLADALEQARAPSG